MIGENESQNSWSNEEFEDWVARGIISMFESKVKKNRKAFPADRLNELVLQRIRKPGLYFGSPELRIPEGDDGKPFVVGKWPMNMTGTLAIPTWGNQGAPGAYGGYMGSLFIAPIGQLPHRLRRSGNGPLFELWFAASQNEGVVEGERRVFAIDSSGQANTAGRIGRDGHRFEWDVYPKHKWEWDGWAAVTVSALIDKPTRWIINALEHSAKVSFGVNAEEIKSLLYARSLPLTATGRKRPILHLVSAHRRRLKNGVDINIDEFLRGTREIFMDGTRFVVQAPKEYDLICRSRRNVPTSLHM